MKKRHSRLVILSLAMVLILVLSLCGCGSKSKDTVKEDGAGKTNAASTKDESKKEETKKSDSEEDKEIIFWNIGTEEVDKAIYDKVIDRFNSTTKSGYTIKSVPIQNDAYKEKLVIAMSSGECPDMYISWSGGPMNEYVDSGYAEDITDMFNASKLPDRLMDGAIAQAKYKDRVYSVPFMDVSISGIYYNTEMFDRFNLKVPKTISEMEAICDTFVSNGIIPFALANGPKWTGSMYFMNLAARYGGLEPFQAAVAGTGSFEDECFIKAGETIQDWVKKGYFPEGCNSLSEDDGMARQLLYQEKAAMSLAGSWYTSVMYQDSEDFAKKMSWFPFPAEDGSSVDSSILIGTVGGNFISFHCTGEKLKAAFECASLFVEDDVVDFMVESGKIAPVKGVGDKITNEMTKTIMESVNNAAAIQLWYDQYLPPAVKDAHLDTCQEMFGLTMTPQEAARQFQQAMQESIADTKK